MVPIQFETQNNILRAEGFTDLPVYLGDNIVISVWQPTQEEVEDIKNGLPVFLCIMTPKTELPPVYVGTENPFIQENEKQQG